MSDMVNIQAVIDQLMSRIAQLELEVAILKSMKSVDIPELEVDPKETKSPGGYM